MYVLCIANNNYSSWSLRPWVLLRELGIPFEERPVPFEEDPAAATFRSFSPTGKVPCLIDQRTVVWDSLGITEYLAERTPPPKSFRIQMHGLRLGSPVESFSARLLDLPATRSWCTDALAETWREPGHEAEAKRAGTWLADLRATAVRVG